MEEEVLHHLLASSIGTLDLHLHCLLETTIGTVVVVVLLLHRRVTMIAVITIEEAEEEITVARGIALAVPIDTVAVVVGADTSLKIRNLPIFTSILTLDQDDHGQSQSSSSYPPSLITWTAFWTQSHTRSTSPWSITL